MIFIIGVCIAVLVESWDLPPGTFEPLGSAPIPQAIAYVIIGLCLIILVRAFITLARNNGVQKTEEEIILEAEEEATGFRSRPLSAAAVLFFQDFMSPFFIFGIMGFGIVTVLFLFGIIIFLLGTEPVYAFGRLLTTFDRSHLAAARPVIIAALIALVMGFGL